MVWTVNLQLLAIIGRFFATGKVDMRKTVAVGGPRVSTPGYVKCISGMCMSGITDMTNDNVEKLQKGCEVRFISGNILTGTNVGKEGYLGFYDDATTTRHSVGPRYSGTRSSVSHPPISHGLLPGKSIRWTPTSTAVLGLS